MTVPYDKRDVDDSEMVYIHPQSQLYLDVNDTTRSVSLPDFPDTIQFPTQAAFLDSMIELFLDPPSGRVQTRRDRLLFVWISYFLTYTLWNLPRVLRNGDLEQEHAEVVQSLKPENQPYFDTYVRSGTRDISRFVLAKARKEELEKLGRYEEARRPLLQPTRGNPDFWSVRVFLD